jgi:hypothetical protein
VEPLIPLPVFVIVEVTKVVVHGFTAPFTLRKTQMGISFDVVLTVFVLCMTFISRAYIKYILMTDMCG